jgi:hypothetical protein
VRTGRALAISALVGALVAVLAPLLVLRADTQTFGARWDGGRDIHVLLQPPVTAPEVQALGAEVAKAEGVRSARVGALPVPGEFCQEFISGGYSLLPCQVQQNPTLYLDVMATTLSRVSAVEAEIIGRSNVLAAADARRMIAAKFASYRGWRDLAAGACVVIVTGIVGLVIWRPRRQPAAP